MSHLIDENVINQMQADLGTKTCHMLINLFIDELTVGLADLEAAFKSDDKQKVEDITHILKNSCALYGAIAVASLAREINDRLCMLNGTFVDTDNLLLDLIRITLELFNKKYNLVRKKHVK
jgi:HPt (histidine-containing phosphotransfer) domain-containing protein